LLHVCAQFSVVLFADQGPPVLERRPAGFTPAHRASSIRFDAIGVVVDEKGAMVDVEHVEG
jgi:hypothetical protein